MRVLITRPREDGDAIAVRLTALGHQPLAAPLLEPRWFAGAPLDFAGIAAILATSANGVRALVRRTERRALTQSQAPIATPNTGPRRSPGVPQRAEPNTAIAQAASTTR